MTIVYFTKFAIKVILLIIMVPILFLWQYTRYRIYRHAFIKNMIAINIPKVYAKNLANEMSIFKLVRKRG